MARRSSPHRRMARAWGLPVGQLADCRSRGVQLGALPATRAHGLPQRTIERRRRRPAPISSPSRWRPVMIDGTKRVEFEDVEVLEAGGLVMRCRVGGKIVLVPP